MRGTVITGLIWGILGLALPTWADPVRIVTRGSIGANEESSSFFLSGDGFTVSGEGPSMRGPWQVCAINVTCPPGTSLNLSATVVPSVIGDPATVDGRVYEGYNYMGGVFLSGRFTIDAGTITAPPVADRTQLLSAPFTFTGVLSGFDNLELAGTPLFSLSLAGRGTATVAFNEHLGGSITSIGYEFEDAAPVPEPATMFLIGSGLCGLALRRRRHLA